MAKPLVVFPDPVIEALRVLRTEGFLLDPVVAQGETKVSRTLPARDLDTARADVIVADDGEGFEGYWPLTESALMRISVWANDGDRAGALARRARAHLLAYKGDAKILDFRGGSRPFVGTDPDDGSPLSSFTIIARLKAE